MSSSDAQAGRSLSSTEEAAMSGDSHMQCADCGGTDVHVIDGVRGARVECGDGGCGASWTPDAAWLDALFAEPERLLATLPEWARQPLGGSS